MDERPRAGDATSVMSVDQRDTTVAPMSGVAASRSTVRCGVLGSLEVTGADGGACTPSGALQRRLLTMLLLRRGQVVSVDAIADALWPDRLPDDHGAGVHTHVFRLRRRVPGLTIDQRAPGYVLRADGVAVDADELELAVSEAAARRHDDPLGALAQLDGALALWRGRPYDDLDELDDATIEADRLEEIRARADEERLAALLDLGRADQVVPDAEALVARDALRERPRELLMTALAAVGRQADALRTYDDLRRRLAIELGIDPSGHLAAVNDRILAGSPAPSTSADPLAPVAVPTPTTAPAAHCPPPLLTRPLIGRQPLADAVDRALERSRVVTLVGTGGVGKTSLAVDAANRLATRFPGGLCFVELAGSSTGSVDVDLLATMGVEPRAGVPPGRRLANVVGPAPTLLVLDNCEHVLDDIAPLVEDAVAHAVNLQILATSRERLAVAGETLVAVPPLRWGDDGDGTDPACDANHATPPALALFVERARDAGVDIELDETTTPIVTEICRRLDGLPLAIELAANRLVSLRLEEIRDGLDHSIRLLSGGRRAVPRHRSIAAALTWSFDLLEERHRVLMAAASAFASPFTAADAAAVAGRPTTEVAELLADLVERSLVHRAADRFVLLEPVRQFVDAAHAGETTRDERVRRHARRIVDVAEELARDVRTTNAAEAFARSRVLVPDLRAAFRTAMADGDLDLAARLCNAVRDPAFHAMLPEPLTWALEGRGGRCSVWPPERTDHVRDRGPRYVEVGRPRHHRRPARCRCATRSRAGARPAVLRDRRARHAGSREGAGSTRRSTSTGLHSPPWTDVTTRCGGARAGPPS
jgi:predicted ATPase/DNA-binding SARP family transcriptional activator